VILYSLGLLLTKSNLPAKLR